MRISKFLVLAWICLSAVYSSHAQSVGQIKSDSGYIYGQGASASLHRADNIAVGVIASKIASDSLSSEIVDTYRGRIASVSDRIVIRDEPDASVFRYMKRSDVSVIFSARRQKVREMLSFADDALERLQIDDALRYLYWADVLSRSLPASGEDYSWVRGKMSSVIDGMKAQIVGNVLGDESVLEVLFTYGGQLVSGVDYSFFNGRDWSSVHSARDGIGVIETLGIASADSIKIKYEFSYSDMPHINREVSEVEAVLGDMFYGGKRSVAGRMDDDVPGLIAAKAARVLSQYSPAMDASTGLFSPVAEAEGYRSAVRKICAAVASKRYGSVEDLFTEEGASVFKKLMEYGRAKVLSFDTLSVYSLAGDVYCRGVPMAFSFSDNNRTFVERVVFTFDSSSGKVSNISFGLEREALNDIAGNELWSEESRIILISFLENYKTAYALKRLDYISSIFDNDALIITGRVLNRIYAGEFGKNRYVILTKQSKEQYIRNLEISFRSKEFINIHFSRNQVVKMGKGGEMYGIQIQQDYFSSNYADSGYLFLMVDLNDFHRPVLHIRTWQEEPDPEFGIIGPYHF